MKAAVVLDYYGFLPSYVSSMQFKINCPFHDEFEASMHIYLKNDSFYCFGCDTGGNMIDFIQEYEDVNRLQAFLKYYRITKDIADNNIEFEDVNFEQCRKKAKLFYNSLSMPSWDLIKHHYMIDERGFNQEILKKFRVKINQSSEYPIIIPLMENGEFKGYIQRRTDGNEPKYLYNDGFQRKKTLIGNYDECPILVTEGITDLMKAHQFGFTNSVALLGWKASDGHLEKLDKYATTVISALDNSEKGNEGSKYLKDNFPKRYVRFQYPKEVEDIGEIDMQKVFDFAIKRTRKKYKRRYSNGR